MFEEGGGEKLMFGKSTAIYAYLVQNFNLPRATEELNCVHERHFRCRVKDIIIGEEESVVIVERYGSYPFIENGWNFILRSMK